MGDSTQVSKEADADTMLAPKRRRSRREVPKVSPFIQAFGTSTVSNLLEYLSIIDVSLGSCGSRAWAHQRNTSQQRSSRFIALH
jgi:hypothetical protein